MRTVTWITAAPEAGLYDMDDGGPSGGRPEESGIRAWGACVGGFDDCVFNLVIFDWGKSGYGGWSLW
jgi:hypothetical protein